MIGRLENWIRRGAWLVLVELALIVALGVSLAHWTWAMVAPGAVAAPAPVNTPGSEGPVPAIRRNLFGVAQAGKGSPVTDASPASGIRLLGVLSRGATGSGRAIFALETGKPKTVEAGSQIVPGHVLKEVYSDYVLVARNGVIERLKLERRSAVTK
jgi:type II secretory pathway component PulC